MIVFARLPARRQAGLSGRGLIRLHPVQIFWAHSSVVERLVYTEKVQGSIPCVPTN